MKKILYFGELYEIENGGYIATDSSGDTFIYRDKPAKDSRNWINADSIEYVGIILNIPWKESRRKISDIEINEELFFEDAIQFPEQSQIHSNGEFKTVASIPEPLKRLHQKERETMVCGQPKNPVHTYEEARELMESIAYTACPGTSAPLFDFEEKPKVTINTSYGEFKGANTEDCEKQLQEHIAHIEAEQVNLAMEPKEFPGSLFVPKIAKR